MKEISSDIYAVEDSLDGIHYHKTKKGTWNKMWDYFNFDKDIRGHLMLCPDAKVRLRNVTEDKIIGVLKYDKDNNKFLHLSE